MSKRKWGLLVLFVFSLAWIYFLRRPVDPVTITEPHADELSDEPDDDVAEAPGSIKFEDAKGEATTDMGRQPADDSKRL